METKMIYKAINQTMADIGVVGKNSKNTQQGFMFRGIDAVMNALNPAMVKNGIFVVPTVIEEHREERTTTKGGTLYVVRLLMNYEFYAEDGSSVVARVIGEAMDSADKATNKAMSIAFKYACFQTFCIPTEEMRDADPDNYIPEDTKPQVIDELKVKVLKDKMTKKGISEEQICSRYKVGSLAEMTIDIFMKANSALDKTPDVEPVQENLGFN